MTKKLASLVLALVMCLSLCVPAMALTETPITNENNTENVMIELTDEVPAERSYLTRERGIYSDDSYGGFSLTWMSNGQMDILQSAMNDQVTAEYTYDENDLRVGKIVNGIETTFTYGKVEGTFTRMLSENRNGAVINYYYEVEGRSTSPVIKISSFDTDGIAYYLIYDSNGDHVVGIANASGNEIIQYEYTNGIVTRVLGKAADGQWQDVTADATSIGNINRIRYFGDYFDEETGWYYNEAYFDTVNERFIDGGSGIGLLELQERTDTNREAREAVEAPTLRVPTGVQQEVNNLYNSLLTNANYGKSIGYSSNWFSSLSDVEVIARMIYGENTYDWSANLDRFDERKAIGWVVFNRVGAPGIIGNSSLRNVVTGTNQFQSMTGGSSATYNARNPEKAKDAWKEATYNACVLVTTSNYAYVNDMMSTPTGITNQLYFLGLDYFKSVASETQSGLSVSGVPVNSVTLVGIAFNITSMSIINGASKSYSLNCFYNK